MKRSFLVCWSTIAGGSYKRTYSICMYSFLAVTAIYRFFSFFRAAGRVLLGHSDAKILYARTSLMSAMNFPAFWKDGTTPGVVQIPLDKLPRLLPASESDGFLFLPVPPKIKPPICHRFQGRKKALSTPWSRCRPPRKNPATAYVCAYLSRFPSVSACDFIAVALRSSWGGFSTALELETCARKISDLGAKCRDFPFLSRRPSAGSELEGQTIFLPSTPCVI